MSVVLLQAVFRQSPEDFRVEEIPLYRPCGEGAHLWCEIEKRRLTTDEAIAQLCDAFALDRRMVGYAGRKDRHAVARQWISLPKIERIGRPELERFETTGLKILRAAEHHEKLRLGHLRGNRFALRVQEHWSRGPHEREGAQTSIDGAIESFEVDLLARLQQMREHGICNRFGEQRFGRRNDNAEVGAALLRGERPVGEHHLARLLVSAYQSELFHRTLQRRMQALAAQSAAVDELEACRTLVSGDILFDHRTGFHQRLELGGEEPGSEEWDQVASLRASPTGPLFGPDMWMARGVAGTIERSVLEEEALDLESEVTSRILARLRLRGARRPLRVPVEELVVERAPQSLESVESRAQVERTIRFELPPGAYATVVLQQLYGAHALVDGSREVGQEADASEPS